MNLEWPYSKKTENIPSHSIRKSEYYIKHGPGEISSQWDSMISLPRQTLSHQNIERSLMEFIRFLIEIEKIRLMPVIKPNDVSSSRLLHFSHLDHFLLILVLSLRQYRRAFLPFRLELRNPHLTIPGDHRRAFHDWTIPSISPTYGIRSLWNFANLGSHRIKILTNHSDSRVQIGQPFFEVNLGRSIIPWWFWFW